MFYPRDEQLARNLLSLASQRDTFPGLPRPVEQVLVAIAPDADTFRDWIGPAVPEWGAAVAFPDSRRIVMQGSTAGSDAGDPRSTLRHELAHLALHEALGGLPPVWFDEGYASYAAGEWGREQLLATNVALAVRGVPSFQTLDSAFLGGASVAGSAYALAHRAIAELATLDDVRGLSLFFEYWIETRSIDAAMRRAFGLTLAGFEERWQRNTRRRYGMLAIVTDFALVGVIVLAVMLPLIVARRRRDRLRIEALRSSEAEADRMARASAIEELLRTIPPASARGPEQPPAPPPARPGDESG